MDENVDRVKKNGPLEHEQDFSNFTELSCGGPRFAVRSTGNLAAALAVRNHRKNAHSKFNGPQAGQPTDSKQIICFNPDQMAVRFPMVIGFE